MVISLVLNMGYERITRVRAGSRAVGLSSWRRGPSLTEWSNIWEESQFNVVHVTSESSVRYPNGNVRQSIGYTRERIILFSKPHGHTYRQTVSIYLNQSYRGERSSVHGT